MAPDAPEPERQRLAADAADVPDDRSIVDRSIVDRSIVDRSITRSPDHPIARSLDRSIARCHRSITRSLDRSMKCYQSE